MRPSECVAKRCNMSNGRNYCYDENHDYLLILCACCGSNGVHECCLSGTDDFTCNDCGPPPAKKRRLLNDTIAIDTISSKPLLDVPSKKRRKTTGCIDNVDMNNNVQMKSSTTKPKYLLRGISIKLTRLENTFKKWMLSFKLLFKNCKYFCPCFVDQMYKCLELIYACIYWTDNDT